MCVYVFFFKKKNSRDRSSRDSPRDRPTERLRDPFVSVEDPDLPPKKKNAGASSNSNTSGTRSHPRMDSRSSFDNGNEG